MEVAAESERFDADPEKVAAGKVVTYPEKVGAAARKSGDRTGKAAAKTEKDDDKPGNFAV